MECYFDNSATTPLLPEVLEEINLTAKELYGNPSSVHRKGLTAERRLKRAREIAASSLGASPREMIFTSGGSESNNLALKGLTKTASQRGKHIISSMVEHDAVYQTLRFLEEECACPVTYLQPDRQGQISVDQVLQAVREETFLIALMQVNNETGALLDLKRLSDEVGKRNQERRQKIHLHVDAVQSFLKVPIDLRQLSAVSTMSISAHKVHGPKGVGILYRRQDVRLIPLIHGGGQEEGYRSGTENTIGILGLAKAVELQAAETAENRQRLDTLKKYFLQRLIAAVPDVIVHSPKEGAPHICNFSVLGIRGEILVHALEEEEIYVSTGSACSSKKKGSRILESMRLPADQRESALRFSFSTSNTKEQVDYAIDVLAKKTAELRKILKYRPRKEHSNV